MRSFELLIGFVGLLGISTCGIALDVRISPQGDESCTGNNCSSLSIAFSRFARDDVRFLIEYGALRIDQPLMVEHARLTVQAASGIATTVTCVSRCFESTSRAQNFSVHRLHFRSAANVLVANADAIMSD